MKKIAIVGYSHTVAILDGIGTWRDAMDMNRDRQDISVTAAFQGWHDVDKGVELFDITPKKKFKAFKNAKFCLLTPKMNCFPMAKIGMLGNGEVQITSSPVLPEFLEKAKEYDVLVSCINGGEHGINYYYYDMPEYDFAPYEDDSTSRQPIDRLYITHHLDRMANSLTAVFYVMAQWRGSRKIIHIAPPPPPKDHHLIKSRSERDELFVLHRPASPSMQMKWYRAFMERVRFISRRFGIILLEPVAECLTEDGFLKPEYADGHTHGNDRYGELMVERLAELIGE